MELPVKRKSLTCINVIWCGVWILLSAGQGVCADSTPNDVNSRPEDNATSSVADANDPDDELWWRRWDAVVKDPNDPNELVHAKLNAVITVLQSQEPEQTLKEKIIDKIISPTFDFELMSKLVLGRTHWPKLTPDEQQKFMELFTERLKKSYLEKITLYKDEKVQLAPAVVQKMGIYISMDVQSNDNKIAVLYKLRKADAQWKIYDVEVQGVSILLTYRSQFDDMLRRGSVKDVLTQLEKPATK